MITEQIIINIDSVTSEATAKYFMKQMSEWEMYLWLKATQLGKAMKTHCKEPEVIWKVNTQESSFCELVN